MRSPAGTLLGQHQYYFYFYYRLSPPRGFGRMRASD
jgi:hypothetical protein